MSTEWEEIARRELAEHQRRFFEEEVESYFSAHLSELRKPGGHAAEREALLKLIHRLVTATEFLLDDAEDVGALDAEDSRILCDGVDALSSAALVVGDDGLADTDTSRERFEEAVEAVTDHTEKH